MTDRLSPELVDSSLEALPHWSGDSTGIARTVEASPDDQTTFLASLAESATAMDHHPDVEHVGPDLRIVLTTHSAGGVTSQDIAMASVIEDLLAGATGEPAEHVHHEPLSEGEATAPADTKASDLAP
jgi:4a-hydroxytetrahydrobiopterin dehydratase